MMNPEEVEFMEALQVEIDASIVIYDRLTNEWRALGVSIERMK